MFRNTTKKSPFLAYRDAYERIVRCKRPHQTDSGSRLTKTAVDFVAEIRRKEKKVPKIPGNNNSSNRSAAAAAVASAFSSLTRNIYFSSSSSGFRSSIH